VQIALLNHSRFRAALEECLRAAHDSQPQAIAVAISGGADSFALLHCAQEYASAYQLRLLALTVDHQLRPESAAEAAQVAAWAAQAGIHHRILCWEHGGTLSGNMQEAARTARYQLLSDACKQEGISHLLLGHHQDDQAETLLHQLVRGSGVDGLAAMPRARREHNVWLLRPLLDASKATLVEYCTANQLPWMEDPSNQNTRFSRTLLRSMLSEFAPQGLSTARLAETAQHMARAQAALRELAANYADQCITLLPCGAGQLDITTWAKAPEDTRLRLLRQMLQAWQPDTVRPRFAALQDLQQRLLSEPHGRHTLGKLLWQWRAGHVQCHLVHQHLPKMQPVGAADIAPWAALGWQIQLPENTKNLVLAPLGQYGWEFLCTQDRPNVRIARRIAPPAAWQAMPILWLWESAGGYLAKPYSLPHIYPAGEPLPVESQSTGACTRFYADWQPFS
jgi:tRNA(Ile)-lysidine synthetase-like protein